VWHLSNKFLIASTIKNADQHVRINQNLQLPEKLMLGNITARGDYRNCCSSHWTLVIVMEGAIKKRTENQEQLGV